MLVLPEAPLAQRNILAMYAFIDWLLWLDLPQLTSITVVVELLPNPFVVDLFLPFVLLLFYLLYDLRGLFIAAERTLHNPILLQLMLGPLREALQVEGVAAHSGASAGGIASNDLHVADGTEVIFIFFVLLLDDDIALAHPLDVLEELCDLIEVNTSVCDDVA